MLSFTTNLTFTKMQIFWLILASFGGPTGGSATQLDKDPVRINGENGWYVPLANGSLKWWDKKAAEAIIAAKTWYGDLSNRVDFFLHTTSSPDPELGELITASSHNIALSSFKAAHPTIFVIHGWLQCHLSRINKSIRKAWLTVGEYNVIIVDWHRGKSLNYFSAFAAVEGVGQQVARMIDYLATHCKMSLDSLRIVGFSLGAHVAGFAGKYVRSGKVNAIIALDAALPLFSYNNSATRLNSSDASYVESIHTNAGILGFKNAIGKADFYINGGVQQPGCKLDILGQCSHARAPIYYAQAVIENNFPAAKCKNYNYALAKKCKNDFGSVHMAAEANAHTARGSYYVPLQKPPDSNVVLVDTWICF